ncbi:MAG: hypothetical protein GYA17_07660 [Chloroflexi bacterium]|nr:hypothetical protein [Anaerolineaceae bacterium]NMB88221.1 hypothetical protein [Chloroflexota bacterium]
MTKKFFTAIVLTSWLLSTLACSRSVIQNVDLTATAVAVEATVNSMLATPQLAASGQGSGDPFSTVPAFETPTQAVETIPPTDTPVPTQTSLPTETATPAPSDTVTSIPPTPDLTENPPILYYTQAGDTIPALAVRFSVDPGEIMSPNPLPAEGLLDPNLLLIIPNRLPETGAEDAVLPDSEIVFSPSAVDFDIDAFVNEAGGYLSTYREWGVSGWDSGAEVVYRVAIENSINPRLLLALIEYQSHWVYGQPGNLAETDYPIGWNEFAYKGLYKQLSWAVQQLSIGYYGWRAGLLTEISFPDQTNLRLSPQVNAGTVAVQLLFSKLYNPREWGGVMYSSTDGLLPLYERMFGNPWVRAQSVEPLYPTTLTQPPFELPFQPGHTWSFSGGPHSAWGPDGALAALDFAPSSLDHGCVESTEWVTAVASGLIVRSGNGIVILDLDGDGKEQTGWSILYLHVATKDRIAAGTWVDTGDIIGHPSCEGGKATGTHVHVVRKYNGEWILADGPLPFVMSGWRVHAGPEPYQGYLTKDDKVATACDCGSYETLVTRPKDQP